MGCEECGRMDKALGLSSRVARVQIPGANKILTVIIVRCNLSRNVESLDIHLHRR